MKQFNPDKLLELYFNGESTVEQEKQLRDYFASGIVEDKHLKYAPLFEYFITEQESVTQVKRSKRGIIRRIIYSSSAAAAVIAFVFLGFNYYNSNSQNEGYAYVTVDGKTIQNVDLATESAQRSLDKIAELIGGAQRHTSDILERVEQKSTIKKVEEHISVINNKNKNNE